MFIKTFITAILFFSAFTSINCILNFFDILPVNLFESKNLITNIYQVEDYNFASIPAFFGLITLLFINKGKLPQYKKAIFYLLTFLFLCNILFTGSKRGFILFLIYFFILAILSFIEIFKTFRNSYHFKRNLTFLLLNLITLIFIFYNLIKLDTNSRKYCYNIIGTNRPTLVQEKIAQNIYKYASVVYREKSYSEIYNLIWDSNFDSTNPESGWGEGIYKKIFPLSGNNIEIVPKNAIGLLLDKNSTFYTSNGNTITQVKIWDRALQLENIVSVTVYCFVSSDYNGGDVSLKAEGDVYGNTIDKYQLSQKGMWQKLSINARCNKIQTKIIVEFIKNNSNDLSKLNGSVTFAYPEIKVKNKYIFNPKDPNSGWGTRIHKTVFPLKGNNVGIVPFDAIGYRMDSTVDAVYYPTENITESTTFISNISTKSKATYKASVYCFVSEDFDISQAAITLPWYNKKIAEGNVTAKYDLTKRNRWQKLEIQFTSLKEGIIEIYLSFLKHDVKDFTKLKGFIIFAYPEFNQIPQNSSALIRKKILDNNENYPQFYSNHKKIYYLPNSIEINKAKIFDTNQPTIFLCAFNPKISSTLKKAISFLLNEDSTYHPYKAKLKDSYSQDKFGEDRISRWKFALEIWTKEYNWPQKIFGGGFNFLNWYGYVFLKDKMASDYPHNPFLYILLYSGIVGVILYIILLYRVVWIYWKYRKEYPLFFIFFLITYYFTFFSGGNPFDPPVMGFFMMLPFLIHSVHKREEQEKLKEIEYSETIN